MSLAVGARLGSCEILSALDSGGMGEVYRARDPRLGRDVAIKILPPATGADPERLRRQAALKMEFVDWCVMHKEHFDGDRIFVIHDFLTGDECRSFITRSENGGYDVASIATAAGPVIDREVRDNARLIADDPALAETLWQRARPFIPPTTGGWYVRGLNERFRFYRYDPGQKFALHYDGLDAATASKAS